MDRRRERASNDASARAVGLRRPEQTRLRPPTELRPGYQFLPGSRPVPWDAGCTGPALRPPGRGHSARPRCPLPGAPAPSRSRGPRQPLARRKQDPALARPGVAGPPNPRHHPPGHEVPGMASLVLCSLAPWNRQLSTSLGRKRSRVADSPSARTRARGFSKGKCIVGCRCNPKKVLLGGNKMEKKSIVICKVRRPGGKEAEHGHSAHPRRPAWGLPTRTPPLSPGTPSPEVGNPGSEEGRRGWDPAASPPTCGHRGAAPEQQQPRAAPHGQEEPRGAGRAVREGSEPPGLRAG